MDRSLRPITEDLLMIAMSVYSADKRIPRSYFDDSWTRCFDINIPVIETEKWNEVRESLVTILNFLTGDKWSFNFRKSTNKFRSDKRKQV